MSRVMVAIPVPKSEAVSTGESLIHTVAFVTRLEPVGDPLMTRSVKGVVPMLGVYTVVLSAAIGESRVKV